jgi:uncharacterized coiled-coil protein SlyX
VTDDRIRELERERAALKERVAELEYWLARRQNAYSRLSHFHERLMNHSPHFANRSFLF